MTALTIDRVMGWVPCYDRSDIEAFDLLPCPERDVFALSKWPEVRLEDRVWVGCHLLAGRSCDAALRFGREESTEAWMPESMSYEDLSEGVFSRAMMAVDEAEWKAWAEAAIKQKSLPANLRECRWATWNESAGSDERADVIRALEMVAVEATMRRQLNRMRQLWEKEEVKPRNQAGHRHEVSQETCGN